MMRSLLYVALTISALGVARATVSAAELTGSTEAQSTGAKIPAGADFSNGPAGGGAHLVGTDHVPTAAEFSNGPTGATVDSTPRRMPSAGEFSNGPAGISPKWPVRTRGRRRGIKGRAAAFVDRVR